MKKIFFIFYLGCLTFYGYTQNVSPYVEPSSSIINNSGFKSAVLRTTPLTRPVPMHVNTDALNRTISPRFEVAKVDLLLASNWAVANGWTNPSNSSLTTANVSSPAIGCNAYFEVGAPAGTWRVPTQKEMSLIFMVRYELASLLGLTGLSNSGTYWTSTQNSATQAWALTINSGIMYNRSKTTNYLVRCIRDL